MCLECLRLSISRAYLLMESPDPNSKAEIRLVNE